MRKYEAMFILYSTLEEEERTSVIEKISSIIESAGSVEKIDEWGNRKLAYEIKKVTEGYYVLFNFQAETEAIDELDRVSKISDQIIRHMIVREEE